MRFRTKKKLFLAIGVVGVVIGVLLVGIVGALLGNSAPLVAEQGLDGLVVRDRAGTFYLIEQHSWDLYEVSRLEEAPVGWK